MTISPMQPSYVTKTEFHKFAGEMHELKDTVLVLAEDFDKFQTTVAHEFERVHKGIDDIRVDVDGMRVDMEEGFKVVRSDMAAGFREVRSEIASMKDELLDAIGRSGRN